LLDYLPKFRYNRVKDWLKLLSILEDTDIQKSTVEKSSCDNSYVEGETSVLRALMIAFDDEYAKRYADGKCYQILGTEISFWNYVSSEMKNGELLHIAIEVGSLIGVRATASPLMTSWINGKGKNALQVSVEKWGADQEISKFLSFLEQNFNGKLVQKMKSLSYHAQQTRSAKQSISNILMMFILSVYP